MEEKRVETPTLEEMTKEQLLQAVKSQATEIKRLRAYAEQNQIAVMFRRLDYLFKVLEESAAFDDDVIELASSEIITLMWSDDGEEVEGETVEEEKKDE